VDDLKAALSGKPQTVRITEICSVPLSGSQISPARPRICRTLAFSRGIAYRSNFSVRGSKARIALLLHSLSQTISHSSGRA
jgi:hypothetical protein